MSISIGAVSRVLLHYEIEACEKRLAYEKENGNIIERLFPDQFPPGTHARLYENDLNWLYSVRDRGDTSSFPPHESSARPAWEVLAELGINPDDFPPHNPDFPDVNRATGDERETTDHEWVDDGTTDD